MLNWKTRLTVAVGTLGLLALALGFGGNPEPVHFGW
jgi:hypothetical protein